MIELDRSENVPKDLLENWFYDGGATGARSVLALIVLRSVRTEGEGAFIPHLALSMAILLAFVCVATLAYFVGHMAGRLVSEMFMRLSSEKLSSNILGEAMRGSKLHAETHSGPIWLSRPNTRMLG